MPTSVGIFALVRDGAKHTLHLDSQAEYYPVLLEYAQVKHPTSHSPDEALCAYFTHLSPGPLTKVVHSTVISILGATRDSRKDRLYFVLELHDATRIAVRQITGVEFFRRIYHAI